MKKEDKKLYELGKKVAAVIDVAGADRKAMMVNGFLRGLAQGFGAVVGGTFLVALLIWLLGLFNQLPLIGDAVEAISNTVQSNKE